MVPNESNSSFSSRQSSDEDSNEASLESPFKKESIRSNINDN